MNVIYSAQLKGLNVVLKKTLDNVLRVCFTYEPNANNDPSVNDIYNRKYIESFAIYDREAFNTVFAYDSYHAEHDEVITKPEVAYDLMRWLLEQNIIYGIPFYRIADILAVIMREWDWEFESTHKHWYTDESNTQSGFVMDITSKKYSSLIPNSSVFYLHHVYKSGAVNVIYKGTIYGNFNYYNAIDSVNYPMRLKTIDEKMYKPHMYSAFMAYLIGGRIDVTHDSDTHKYNFVYTDENGHEIEFSISDEDINPFDFVGPIAPYNKFRIMANNGAFDSIYQLANDKDYKYKALVHCLSAGGWFKDKPSVYAYHITQFFDSVDVNHDVEKLSETYQKVASGTLLPFERFAILPYHRVNCDEDDALAVEKNIDRFRGDLLQQIGVGHAVLGFERLSADKLFEYAVEDTNKTVSHGFTLDTIAIMKEMKDDVEFNEPTQCAVKYVSLFTNTHSCCLLPVVVAPVEVFSAK